MEELTIRFSLTSDGEILAVCQELNLSVVADSKYQANEQLATLIDEKIFNGIQSGKLPKSDFVRQMYGGDEAYEGFEDWLRETEHQQFQAKLLKAFFKSYPKANTGNGFDHIKIPFVDWDYGDRYEKWIAFEKHAYQDLIDNGGHSEVWRRFVQCLCAAKFFQYRKSDWVGVHKRWTDIDLPVLSFKELESIERRFKGDIEEIFGYIASLAFPEDSVV